MRVTPSLVQRFALCALLGFGVLLSACRKNEKPAMLTNLEMQTALEKAFKQTGPEARALVDAVLTALESGQTPQAFLQVNALAGSPGLTKEQTKVVAQCRVSLNLELQAKAAKGETDASSTLELYRTSK